MFERILNNFIKTKREYIQNIKPQNIIAEILPSEISDFFPIDKNLLMKLHQFVSNNPIYFKKTNILINNLNFTSYEGDVNEFYLNSKKYDTNYQPFFPTWLFSAFLLCLKVKDLGFTELVDIGAGDGRIPYCAKLLRLRSVGIELDQTLTKLQNDLCEITDVKFKIINDDASSYDFSKLELSKPIFLISGLAEMGEMFIDNIIQTILQNKFESAGIILLGSTTIRKFASDLTIYGWGRVIKKYNLQIIYEISLPTHWTNDNNTETKYLITQLLDTTV